MRATGDRPIARWMEAFETANEDRDIVIPRLRELRAKRGEIAATIAKVIPLRAPPTHLYAETTIKRFQETIRELILSADHTLAKNYLRFLVDRITVRGNEVEILGRTDSAVALLASASEAVKPANVNRPAEVLTSVGGWLQRLDSNQGPGG